jgi:peptidoglycan/LPS O-acetylase OafA/YrhL
MARRAFLPLFLVHSPTIILLGFVLKSADVVLSFWLHLAFLCAASLFVAYGLVLAVERPVMRWRKAHQAGKQVNPATV